MPAELVARALDGDAADLEDVGAADVSSAMFAFCSTTSTVSPSSAFRCSHDPEQLLDDRRRQPERRLVEHQQPRPGDERAREREHLLLAAAQRAGLLLARAASQGK